MNRDNKNVSAIEASIDHRRKAEARFGSQLLCLIIGGQVRAMTYDARNHGLFLIAPSVSSEKTSTTLQLMEECNSKSRRFFEKKQVVDFRCTTKKVFVDRDMQQ